MKTDLRKSGLLFIVCMFFLHPAFGQGSGRVVINEYMPWTSNGCGTTSEFIELLNFGPGPIDIGCYVLTTGRYSITFPANIILQPGDFFVVAGRDFIPNDCANIDSSGTGVHADLNWNTCNCTNVPIPTTGDGLMTDGGSSNTPLVLLDNNLSVIDAVVRSLPSEAATTITASSVNGGCLPKTFNIDQLPVVYEQLGMSAGRGNSFARVLDGDCGWLKDPQQSGNASNNRNGRTSDITYSFSIVDAVACTSIGGRVDVYVEHMDLSTVFPMNYTIATDLNRDGIFDLSDSYASYVDSTPPFIEVKSLPVGRYRLTVSSRNGCYLQTFEFSILPCEPVLPVQLEYFRYAGFRDGQHHLEWKLHGLESLQTVVVQKEAPDGSFTDGYTMQLAGSTGSKSYFVPIAGNSSTSFRLRILTRNSREFFSAVVNTGKSIQNGKIWPNPTTGSLNLQLPIAPNAKASYIIYASSGKVVGEAVLKGTRIQSTYSLDLSHLPTGIYHLQVSSLPRNEQPIPFRFVKH